MPILLDHLIVPSKNRVAAARQLAGLLGVPWAEQAAIGPFSPVYVNSTLTLDFDEWPEPVPKQHYCFRVPDAEFDAILSRIMASGLAFRSTPLGEDDGKVNPAFGGRLVYWSEPDGHAWEILTVSYARPPAAPAPHAGDAKATLVPMSEADYAAYVAGAIPNYAAEKVASGQWTEAESLALSKKSLDELLPQGRQTPDNHLFTVLDDQSVPVGMLWVAAQARAGERVAYVYDVSVKPEHRRKGHAASAFIALEGKVRELGLAGIALHVFGHNAAAQALYAKLGYAPTNINMYKPLPRTGA